MDAQGKNITGAATGMASRPLVTLEDLEISPVSRRLSQGPHAGELPAGYLRVLHLMAADAPLLQVLEALVSYVEEESAPGTLASILLMDDDGLHLRYAAAPSLPQAYVSALDRLPIGPDAGSCGTAAYTKHPVYVSDIETDLLWQKHRDVAMAHGLRACWSTPIMSSRGQVLGTFAMFDRESRAPNNHDLSVVEMATRTAAIAIEGMHTRQSLRASDRRFKDILNALPAAVYTTDSEGRLTHFNRAAVQFSGRVPELATDEWCVSWKLYYPDGTPMPHDECPMAVAVKEGRILRGKEAIAERPDGTRVWFTPYPTPLHDEAGRVVGAVNMLVDITEKKEVENAIGHLAAIVASSQDLIVSTDLGGIILSWNESATKLFGYTADEMRGQYLHTIVPADRLAEESEILARVVRGEGVRDHDTVRRLKDGRLIDVSLTVSPIQDNTGRVIGASWIARDITQQKIKQSQQHALYELATSVNQASRLTDLYDKALTAIMQSLKADRASILLMDQNGIMRFQAARGLSAGYQQAVEGHSPWDRNDPDPREVVIPDIAKAGIDSQLEAVVVNEGIQALAFIPLTYGRRLIGKFMFYFDRPHPLSEQEVQHARAIAQILASGIERKRAEDALRASEEHLRAVVETTPACIKVVGPDGTLLDMNPAGLVLVEADQAEEVKGKSVYDIVTNEHRDAFKSFNERICKGEKGSLEFDILGLHGTRRRMETHAVPLRGPDGSVRQLAITQDVTERKRNEAALRTSEERLRSLASELEQRVEARTQELVQSQEQLRALSTELNLAEQRERKRLAAELHDHLQQLLVLAKIKVGQGKRRQEAGLPGNDLLVQVDAVLSDALAYTRTLVAELSPPVLRDHGLGAGLKWLADYMKKHDMVVTVVVPHEQELSLPEDQLVLLFQSVRELLINSWKHAGTGQARVAMSHEGALLRIEVVDEGKGFTMETVDRSGDLSSKFGLFSIRERMRAVGGAFHIDSHPLSGTRAVLELPLSQPLAASPAMASPSSGRVKDEKAPYKSGCIRALLVDDHAMVRQGLRSVLEGYTDVEVVAEAATGLEAIEFTGQYRPDVVVMDINMPRMSGVEATQHIKRDFPSTVVVGLSVNADGDNQQAMRSAGAALLLTKEAAVERLYAAIQEAVKIHD